MTKNNLLKRHIDKGRECLFCACDENTTHLFFDCVVSSAIWEVVQSFLKKPVGANYARMWVSKFF